ncbi:type 1 glutamine amidotransferase [Saliphagus sp. GCM10025334]
MRLACIQPPNRFDYGTAIQRIVTHQFPDVEFRVLDPRRDQLHSVVSADAVIITGSHARINRRPPFLVHLEDAIRAAVAESVPILGVCFGHQAVASVLGGTIETLPERSAGFEDIDLTEAGSNHDLFAGFDRTTTSFCWHRDHVREPLPDARVLATNRTGVQAFESIRAPAFGIQFHPEFDRSMVETILRDRLASNRCRQHLSRSVTPDRYAEAQESRRLFTRFLEQYVVD